MPKDGSAQDGPVRRILRGAVSVVHGLPVAGAAQRLPKAHFQIWSEVDENGVNLLERVFKKSDWRGPRETGTQRLK